MPTSFNHPLISVHPEQKLSEVYAIMITYDFNKLPVIEKDGRLLGLITSTSILKTFFNYSFNINTQNLPAREAMEAINSFDNIDFIKISDYLASAAAVCITDKGITNRIITNYDAAQFFKRNSEDSMMVSSIEEQLKMHILSAYDSKVVVSKELQQAIDNINDKHTYFIKSSLRKLFNESVKSSIINKAEEDNFFNLTNKVFPHKSREFQDLDLNDYVKLAINNWNKLSLAEGFEVSVWETMMEEIIIIRDYLANFRRTLTPLEHGRLVYCEQWFNKRRAKHEIREIANITDNNNHILHNEGDSESGNSELASSSTDSNESDSLKFLKFLQDYITAPTFDIQFKSIEQMLKSSLPDKALKDDVWWIDEFTNSESWYNAGWRIGEVDAVNQKVTFFYWHSRINTNNEESEYWCKRFNCTLADLNYAVQQVGTNPIEVEEHLNSTEEL